MKKSLYCQKVVDQPSGFYNAMAGDEPGEQEARALEKMTRFELLARVREETNHVLSLHRPPDTEEQFRVMTSTPGEALNLAMLSAVDPKSRPKKTTDLLKVQNLDEILDTYRLELLDERHDRLMLSREDFEKKRGKATEAVPREVLQKMEQNQFFRDFIQQYDNSMKASLQVGYRYLPRKGIQLP